MIFKCSDYCIKIKSTITVLCNNVLLICGICVYVWACFVFVWFDFSFFWFFSISLRYRNRYSNEYMRPHWKGYKHRTTPWAYEWMNEWVQRDINENAYIQRAAAATIILTAKPHTCDFEDTHYICSQEENIEWDKYESIETERDSATEWACESESEGRGNGMEEMVLNRSRHIASNIDIWFSHFLIFFCFFFSIILSLCFSWFLHLISVRMQCIRVCSYRTRAHCIELFHCVRRPIFFCRKIGRCCGCYCWIVPVCSTLLIFSIFSFNKCLLSHGS